jgi:hypothetical protein
MRQQSGEQEWRDGESICCRVSGTGAGETMCMSGRPASQLGLGEAAPNGEEDRRWRWTQPVVDAGWELRGAKTIEMLDLHEDLMGI